MNKALLDSDTFSEVLKAKNPTVARNAAAYRQMHGTLSISAVTVMEGAYGFQRILNPARLQAFLAAVATEEVLDFDSDAAALAGRISGDLDRTGQTIGFADPMIVKLDGIWHGFFGGKWHTSTRNRPARSEHSQKLFIFQHKQHYRTKNAVVEIAHSCERLRLRRIGVDGQPRVASRPFVFPPQVAVIRDAGSIMLFMIFSRGRAHGSPA